MVPLRRVWDWVYIPFEEVGEVGSTLIWDEVRIIARTGCLKSVSDGVTLESAAVYAVCCVL
jgi:hypothetical protein